MRRVFWVPIVVVYGFVLWAFGVWGRTLPGTELPSGRNVARLTQEKFEEVVTKWEKDPAVVIHLPDRVEKKSLQELGLHIEKENLKNKVFSKSFSDEVFRISRGLFELGKQKVVTPVLASSSDKIIFPVEPAGSSRIVYDAATGKFTFDPPLHDYVLETADIMGQVKDRLGHDSIDVYATARKVSHQDDMVNDLNARLASASSEEIVVRVKDGKFYSDIKLYPSEIRSMLAFSTRGDSPVLDIDRTVFENTVAAKLTDRQKEDFQLQEAYPNTVELLNTRFGFNDTDKVVLGIDDGPNSDGTLADRYMEVDISQQKMYFFVNGSVYKEFRVSTGYDYPTPPGEFHILNKSPKAFSKIYDVWMEYWMAFHWAGDIGASLGIHEIAYDLDEKGNRVYHLGDYIGEPKTGGCVALKPGDSKEVYDLSYVGMLVKIVK
jgi:hypothetical protein